MLGALIEQAPKAKGARGQLRGRGVIGGSPVDPPITTPTLAEQGVDKKTANVARKLAALSDTELNAVVDRHEAEAGWPSRSPAPLHCCSA